MAGSPDRLTSDEATRSLWDRIRQAFDAVIDLPREQQHHRVLELLAGYPDAVAEVLELLAEDAAAAPFLDGGYEPLAASLQVEPFIPDREIGPYRLVRLLGEGGVGVVYLARRNETGALVAIKLLRDAWVSPSRRSRFLAEERALSALSHPSIARIYDAGYLPDGTPWFAMEYVEGEPITDFWRHHPGTPTDCLRLFRRVCSAVLHAHSRAIIHRDLKPSNILVTPEGEVKLLDFGIAKQIDAAADADRTRTGLRLMTPAYCAPEQRSGAEVGVFTDVYALGILLYELLSGRLPDLGDPPSTGAAPSRKLSSLLPAYDLRYAALSRSERGDLDILCLTACRHDPELRYATVDGLLRDVDAFLEGRPLLARPESAIYVFTKFLRRNQRPLSALTLAVLLFGAAALFFTVRLRDARNAALAEAGRTRLVQQFTENLFAGGDRNAGPARDLRVLELLDRGRQQAGSLRSDPSTQADMNEALGAIYRKLGKLDIADTLLSSAVSERKALHTPAGQGGYAESLVELALLRTTQARYDEAEHLAREALDHLGALHTAGRTVVAHANHVLGSVLTRQGRYPEGEATLRSALSLLGSEPSTERIDILTGLADIQFYRGLYAESESLNRQALAMAGHLVGETHPMVADILNTLAQIEQTRGEDAASERDFRRAIAITVAWYGENHPATAANLTAFSSLLVAGKRFDEADRILRQALSIQEAVYGPTNGAVATALNNLGTLEYARDQDDAAELHFRRALAIWRSLYGDRHQFVGTAFSNLAGVYMDRKDFRQAEEMCRQALAVFLVTLPEKHLNTAVVRVKLGRVLLHQGRFAEAETQTLAAYQTLVGIVGPHDSYLVGSRKDLVKIYTALNKPELAAPFQGALAK